MRALYLGDEAIVDTQTFSLEGRAIRKVRQSVHGWRRPGTASRRRRRRARRTAARGARGRVGAGETELRSGASRWRWTPCAAGTGGRPRCGADADGVMRGFIHFVPSYGRPAMSLSLMRRDRETPNGLMEFLVVRAIDALKARGVAEISLNFAAFGRWLERPEGRAERLLGRGIALANPFFQIESLHRFNAKFAPRWEPRYLVYEHAARWRGSVWRRCESRDSSRSSGETEPDSGPVLRAGRRSHAVDAAARGLRCRRERWRSTGISPGSASTSCSRERCSARRYAVQRSPLLRSFAAGTGALLLADAWFDVVTASTSGGALVRRRPGGCRRAAAGGFVRAGFQASGLGSSRAQAEAADPSPRQRPTPAATARARRR